MSCSLICFSRKPVGLEVSTLNLKPYRLFAVNVSCNMRENVARDSFAKHFFFRNFGRRKTSQKNCSFSPLDPKPKICSRNQSCQLSVSSKIGTCGNTSIGSTFFFKQSNWGKYEPAQPSPHSSDLYFWIWSKNLSQLTETLLAPSASSSVTSSLLGLSATLLLVGTLANQTFS